MAVLIGTRLYGRTDEVPGVGFVATPFLFLNYFPLFPTGGSLLVTETSGILRQEFAGHALPLSLKSVLLGYGRAAAWVVSVAWGCLSLLGLAVWLQTQDAAVASAAAPTFLLAALALAVSYQRPLRAASWARAQTLGRLAGVDRAQALELAVHYGQIEASQAESELDAPCAMADLETLRRRAKAACARRCAAEQAPAESVRVGRAVPTSTPRAVKFACPHCATTMKVPEAAVGRLGRCTSCSSALRVPAAA